MLKPARTAFYLFPLLMAILLLLPSCFPYKIATKEYVLHKQECTGIDEFELEAADHWLYCLIPRHRCQIRPFDYGHLCSWALFGNDDDGIFGEAPSAGCWSKKPIGPYRSLCWNLRNPLHNFCFYLIGSADSCNSSFTFFKFSPGENEFLCYHKQAPPLFTDRQTGLYLALHGWKPFFYLRYCYSDTKRSDFYLGWRERGNFGAKCHFIKNIKDK